MAAARIPDIRRARARQVDTFFSEVDLKEVEGAVRDAEATTAGEIVPYAVSRSDRYMAAAWKGATLGAVLCAMIAAVAYTVAGYWGPWFPGWIALHSLAGATAGFAAAGSIRSLTLWLTGPAVIEHRVRQRAQAAFLEHEVFHTRDRTGVLIFLSLFERRVVVLADSGINSCVEQHEWDAIVTGIVDGIRRGVPGRALAGAIQQCGELLTRHRIAARSDDANELPDQLQVRRE